MPTFAEVLANSQKSGAAAGGGAEADGEKNLDEIDDGPEDKWTLSKLGLGHGTAEDYAACGAFLEESSCEWPSPEIDRPRRCATLLDGELPTRTISLLCGMLGSRDALPGLPREVLKAGVGYGDKCTDWRRRRLQAGLGRGLYVRAHDAQDLGSVPTYSAFMPPHSHDSNC